MGIGIRLMPDDPGLQENMFLSNEPGYYENGQFGIRIEDIVRIVPTTVGRSFGARGALAFETITMCPVQTKLIKVDLLTENERETINRYHEQVYETLLPLLKDLGDEHTLTWLHKETRPI